MHVLTQNHLACKHQHCSCSNSSCNPFHAGCAPQQDMPTLMCTHTPHLHAHAPPPATPPTHPSALKHFDVCVPFQCCRMIGFRSNQTGRRHPQHRDRGGLHHHRAQGAHRHAALPQAGRLLLPPVQGGVGGRGCVSAHLWSLFTFQSKAGKSVGTLRGEQRGTRGQPGRCRVPPFFCRRRCTTPTTCCLPPAPGSWASPTSTRWAAGGGGVCVVVVVGVSGWVCVCSGGGD
jgi:hypothetical protein